MPTPHSCVAEGDVSRLRSREYCEAYLKSITTFPAPPAGFDPRTAGARELALYGFPARPRSRAKRDLARLWDKAFVRIPKPVRAQLEIDEVLLAGILERERKQRDGRFGPGGWGGFVAQTKDFKFSPPEPANVVYGEWSVPRVQPDLDDNVPMTVGFWVGLDGWGNNQVLQAGSATTVAGEKVDYWSWFEWYPDPPVRIANFPIEPGDLITVLVCAPSSRRGFASFLNRTTGVSTSVGFDPPPGTTSLGASAEWIVEGVSGELPNWVLMGFHECSASTKSHTIDLSRPTRTEIGGTKGDLTLSLNWRPNKVLVLWQGGV